MKNRQIISSIVWALYCVVIVFALYTGFLCNFVYNGLGLLLLLVIGFGTAVWANMGKGSMCETILSPKTLKMLLGIYSVILLIVLFGMRYSTGDFKIGFSSDYVKYNSNLIPFATILNDLNTYNWKVLVGNFFLFIPIGALCPMIWKMQRKKRYFVITVLIVSLFFEWIKNKTWRGGIYGEDYICYHSWIFLGVMVWVMI